MEAGALLVREAPESVAMSEDVNSNQLRVWGGEEEGS